ncbi:MAG TPA: hypothetical protein DCP31_32555 [Cyanobacteria bacterium UBA8543]|nr:hypothetical protein [Cyanobacteria bacterium UBA8543]
MSKEQQPKRKPGSNSPNWELYSGSGKEIDYSSIYCPSLGYGPSLEYGSSLEEMARSVQPTGKRRPVNWSRVTVEPGEEQNAEAKLTVGMSGDLNDAI